MTKHRKLKDKNKTENVAVTAPTPAPSVAAAPKLRSKKEEQEVKEPNLLVRLITFFKDAKRELTRVTWPNRKETVRSTAVLLVLVAISAVYLALVDGILTRLLRLIVG
jgi:preprotein translocase subunit SecE